MVPKDRNPQLNIIWLLRITKPAMHTILATAVMLLSLTNEISSELSDLSGCWQSYVFKLRGPCMKEQVGNRIRNFTVL